MTFLVLICAAVSHASIAQPLSQTSTQNIARIYVIYQEQVSSHQQIIATLQQNTPENPTYSLSYLPLSEIDVLDNIELSTEPSNETDALIIPLGTSVTEQILTKELPYPILSAAIPRLSFRLLEERFNSSYNQSSSTWFSAIYLDQPLTRNLNFIQILLPDARRIGVALGNDNLFLETDLRNELANRELLLSLGKVTSEDQIINTLNQVLDQSDVYLGIVDPLVFSRTSAKNVLQTAYRWRVPLIGISPAYTRAGALGSIYSTPTQIGTQLLEVIESLAAGNLSDRPNPVSPSLFSIAINYQVAEALGLQIEQEDVLVEYVRAAEQPLSEGENND